MMALTKAKLVAVCLLTIVLVGTGALVAQSNGEKFSAPEGVVQDANGKPLAAVNVELAAGDRTVEVYGPPRPDSVRTDAQGRFALPKQSQKYWLVVKCGQGYAEADAETFGKASTLVVQPWGRLRGTVKIGTKSAGVQTVSVMGMPRIAKADHIPIGYSLSANSNQEGMYDFPRVAPGEFIVARCVPKLGFQFTALHPEVVRVRPGKTVEVQLGGTGTTVIGRAATPEGSTEQPVWEPDNFIAAQVARKPPPINLPGATPETFPALLEKWLGTPASHEYRLAFAYVYWLPVAADGAFRIDDLPSGRYVLKFTGVPRRSGDKIVAGRPFMTEFTVPDSPLGYSDEPLDLGRIEIK